MKTFSFIFIIMLSFSVGRYCQNQESSIGQTNYSYNIYFTLSSHNGSNTDSLKEMKIVLSLDKKGFDDIENIIVGQKNLEEAENLTGRSAKFNFKDRLMGWEAALRKHYGYTDESEIKKRSNEIRLNDPVSIDKENYQVTIIIGEVTSDFSAKKLFVELDYGENKLVPIYLDSVIGEN